MTSIANTEIVPDVKSTTCNRRITLRSTPAAVEDAFGMVNFNPAAWSTRSLFGLSLRMFTLQRIVPAALASAAAICIFWVWTSLPPSLPPQCQSACGQNDIPLTIEEKIVVSLVAWIVEDKKLPGFDESYLDRSFMPDTRRFIVQSDFVRRDLMLSNDERVFRIDWADFETVFNKLGYDGHDYIEISITDRTDDKIRVWFTNYFGELAGHGYEFIFTIDGDSFTVDGRCVLVS